MKCKFCKRKEKTWDKSNSPIQCAFEKWIFNENNFNCGTMDFFREVVEECYVWNDDLFAWIVSNKWWFLYLEWYKSRWKTDKCIDMRNISDLTLQEAYNIINYLWNN